jgi:hypothetical protein
MKGATMVIRTCLQVLAAAALAVGCTGRVTTPGLTVDQERAVRSYLNKDCGTGDTADQLGLARVRSTGRGAYAILWSALRHGPTEAERAAVRDSSRATFARLRHFLEQDGLGKAGQEEVRKAALTLEESTYVGLEMAGFVDAYHERALNAVIALQAPYARDSLEQIVNHPALPTRVRDLIRHELDRR